MFWDPDELEFMQLDEFTSQREYYKVNCIGYEKQDQDYFIVEEAVAKWPDQSVEYQYIMENVVVKQVIGCTVGQINIKVCGMLIRNNEERFESEQAWVNYLGKSKLPETFLEQSVQWVNNNMVVCSAYYDHTD